MPSKLAWLEEISLEKLYGWSLWVGDWLATSCLLCLSSCLIWFFTRRLWCLISGLCRFNPPSFTLLKLTWWRGFSSHLWYMKVLIMLRALWHSFLLILTTPPLNYHLDKISVLAILARWKTVPPTSNHLDRSEKIRRLRSLSVVTSGDSELLTGNPNVVISFLTVAHGAQSLILSLIHIWRCRRRG